jgi:hypothetical protein
LQNDKGYLTGDTLPVATGTTPGVTLVYPAASCTTFTSDTGTVTPLAVQKGAKLFAITRPTSTTNKAITRYSNTTGDVQDSKIIIEDVTNTRDSSKKAQVLTIPAEGGKKMVYGYCTDQVDGTSFIGGVFDKSATSYPYNEGLAIGGTSGNLLWKGKRVVTIDDIPSVKDGKTPVKGVDYWTEADQESIVQQVLAVMGMHIIGSVNENNDIVFSGDLDAGTYTLKFEDVEGNVQEVGTIEIVKKDDNEPAYTNMIPKSINADGTPYVGNNGEDGYKTDTRLNSSATESTDGATGYSVTGFIPVKWGDVVNFKNVNFALGAADSGAYIAVYDRNFEVIMGSIRSQHLTDTHYLFRPVETYEDTGYIKSVKMADGSRDYAYLRISAKGLNADSIITVNEPIPDEELGYTNQIPISTDTDGSIYNGVGYKENTRWSKSGGGDISETGVTVSGYIPVKTGDVIRIKNITMNKNDQASNANVCNICYFWSLSATDGASGDATVITSEFSGIFDANGNLTQFTIPESLHPVYIRLNTGYIGPDSILTINEPIPDEELGYTNQIPLSINADGTLYNGGQGWKTGTRLNSSGAESTSNATDVEVTGFIPVKNGDVVYLKNIIMNTTGTLAERTYMWLYDSSFTKLNGRYRLFFQYGAATEDGLEPNKAAGLVTTDENGNITMLTIDDKVFRTGNDKADMNNAAYLRISCEHIDDNSIITVNQPIPDEKPVYTNLANPADSNWVIGKRYNSSNALTDFTGGVISNYIDVAGVKNYIAVKGINLKGENGRIYTYSSPAEKPANYINTTTTSAITAADYDSSVYIIPASVFSNPTNHMWRIGGLLTGTSDDVIITIDEEIIDSGYTDILSTYEPQLNKRWSASSKNWSDDNGMLSVAVPFADIKDKVVRFTGFLKTATANGNAPRWYAINSTNDTQYGMFVHKSGGTTDDVFQSLIVDEGNDTYSIAITSENIGIYTNANVTQIMMCMVINNSGTAITEADLANVSMSIVDEISE